MGDNSQLLRAYAESADHPAFEELVRRQTDLVYSAALRQVGGDAHLAADVTQQVFLALAQNAPALVGHSQLSAWLYTTTRFLAAKVIRTNARRQRREQKEYAMQEISRAALPEPNWEEIRPVIDTAMHELSASDRSAILARYFEAHTIAEMAASARVTEAALRKRLERALNRLQGRLVRRGITSSVAALGAALTTHGVVAAPAGLAGAAAALSTAGGAVGGGGGYLGYVRALEFMQKSKLVMGAAGAVLAVSVGAYLGDRYEARRAAERNWAAENAELAALRRENQQLKGHISRPGNERDGKKSGSAPGAAGSAGAIDELRLLANLQKGKVLAVKVMPVAGKDRKLTDGFADLFKLSPEERTALQAALDKAQGRLAALEKANSTVTRNADGSVVIQIQPFPKEGGAAYDELMSSFAQTLGPERDAAFSSLGSAGQVEDDLGGFGAVQRTLTLSTSAAANGSGVDYQVEEEKQNGNTNMRYLNVFPNQEVLGNHLGVTMNLVPSDFGITK